MSASTFERLIMRFMELISYFIYESLVVGIAGQWKMCKLVRENKNFKTFKYACYATDVTFQQALLPFSSVEEGKCYFSSKHKLYGYKVVVSVLPTG